MWMGEGFLNVIFDQVPVMPFGHQVDLWPSNFAT